ncbi:hypothetical protein BDK62_103408 [Halomonas alkaliantarctica]|nr:hypothetical protein [uncultured Halomonas sp.]TDV98774.1 hypothetical protein BDK62_103408 [Halomonas alkaliantarctica]
MPSLPPDVLAILLPIGILIAALLLFGSGLLWARYRDRHSERQDQEDLTQEVLDLIEPWAGSRTAAWAWYQTYTIPALGDLTAEQLMMQGRAHDLIAYLAHVREGGYA